MSDLKLTLADQVLINAVGALCAQPFQDKSAQADARMMLDIIDDVLPHVSRQAPLIDALAKAAAELRATDREAKGWAQYNARSAIADILRWRTGLAYDRFQNQAEGRAA